jgi:uncharacterized protein (TIGR02118 family)
MVKVIVLLKRKEGVTREEFARHWQEAHGPLAANLPPGLRRYVQNHPVQILNGGEQKFDGVAEIWYDDIQSVKAVNDFYLSQRGMTIREDEKKYFDMSKAIFLVVEEKVIRE